MGRPDDAYASNIWKMSEDEQIEMNVVQLAEPERCDNCRTQNTIFAPRSKPDLCYVCYLRSIKRKPR